MAFPSVVLSLDSVDPALQLLIWFWSRVPLPLDPKSIATFPEVNGISAAGGGGGGGIGVGVGVGVGVGTGVGTGVGVGVGTGVGAAAKL